MFRTFTDLYGMSRSTWISYRSPWSGKRQPARFTGDKAVDGLEAWLVFEWQSQKMGWYQQFFNRFLII
jgi:cation diffusion facilitator CzcD-associated flavoprotein CzcO